MTKPTLTTLLGAFAAAMTILAAFLNSQWNDAARATDEAVAARIAVETETKLARDEVTQLKDQIAQHKSSREAAESTLKTLKEQIGQLQKAGDASSALLKAAQDQAKQAIAGRDAAEATARAANEQAQNIKQAADKDRQSADKELGELRGQLTKERTAREAAERTLAEVKTPAAAPPSAALPQ